MHKELQVSRCSFKQMLRRMAIENGLIICLAISREVYSVLKCSEEKQFKQILRMPKKKTLMKL